MSRTMPKWEHITRILLGERRWMIGYMPARLVSEKVAVKVATPEGDIVLAEFSPEEFAGMVKGVDYFGAPRGKYVLEAEAGAAEEGCHIRGLIQLPEEKHGETFHMRLCRALDALMQRRTRGLEDRQIRVYSARYEPDGYVVRQHHDWTAALHRADLVGASEADYEAFCRAQFGRMQAAGRHADVTFEQHIATFGVK